ncbi:hypothetical protein GOP47_0027189 [Adiantum capillus-veneris]|nr:hypothetical protein GOP47_0027189 [Adiantum capillus-veneris]
MREPSSTLRKDLVASGFIPATNQEARWWWWCVYHSSVPLWVSKVDDASRRLQKSKRNGVSKCQGHLIIKLRSKRSMWVTCGERARFFSSFFLRSSIIRILLEGPNATNISPLAETVVAAKHSQILLKNAMLKNCFLLSSSLLKIQKLFIS